MKLKPFQPINKLVKGFVLKSIKIKKEIIYSAHKSWQQKINNFNQIIVQQSIKKIIELLKKT